MTTATASACSTEAARPVPANGHTWRRRGPVRSLDPVPRLVARSALHRRGDAIRSSDVTGVAGRARFHEPLPDQHRRRRGRRRLPSVSDQADGTRRAVAHGRGCRRRGRPQRRPGQRLARGGAVVPSTHRVSAPGRWKRRGGARLPRGHERDAERTAPDIVFTGVSALTTVRVSRSPPTSISTAMDQRHRHRRRAGQPDAGRRSRRGLQRGCAVRARARST